VTSYFLGTQHLGDSPIVSDSIAYFCRRCGDIWARAVAGSEWQIEQTPCEAHASSGVADWNKVPGSLLNGLVSQNFLGKFLHAAAIESFPPEVIRREFTLHLDYYEQQFKE